MARSARRHPFGRRPIADLSETRTAFEGPTEPCDLAWNPGCPVGCRNKIESIDPVDTRTTAVPLRVLEPHPLAERRNLRRHAESEGHPHATFGIEGVEVRT